MCDLRHVIHERNPKFRGIHTQTQGDRQRSFKILILIRYKSANKSFFILFVVEKRAGRKIGATQGLLHSYQLFFFITVYLPNDNLYYFLCHQCPPLKLFYLKLLSSFSKLFFFFFVSLQNISYSIW